MNSVIADRYTTHIDQPFVVFLIGMRVNKLTTFKKWMGVAGAFPGMLKVLQQHPEKGFLGGEQFFRVWPLTTILVSYWRSFEDLEHFARSKDDPHLAAWQAFNREIGKDGSVGIWHETYTVADNGYEAIYVNMPQFGLAKATQQVVPVSKGRARERMQGTPQPVEAQAETVY